MRIYLSPCCAEKDPALRGTGKAVTPDHLYMEAPIRAFMDRCKQANVRWAIFSDLYGVWFPEIVHDWYEKDPDTLTEAEFEALKINFDERLTSFGEILFYSHSGSLHPFHRRILSETVLADKVRLITTLDEIV